MGRLGYSLSEIYPANPSTLMSVGESVPSDTPMKL